MAAIDKIYGTVSQWVEFHEWCRINKPEALDSFYESWEEWETDNAQYYDSGQTRTITNFSTEMDEWMIQNCPLEWVTDYIAGQYGCKAVDEARKKLWGIVQEDRGSPLD